MRCGIVGNGPAENHPNFNDYKDKIDIWIGADRGALYLAEKNISIKYAIGDFDSINNDEKTIIKRHADFYEEHLAEKDETDLELALEKAYELHPNEIFLFGVTGGRLDHELANIQLLYSIRKKGIRGILVDCLNMMEITFPGKHRISNDENFPYISFIPLTMEVEGLTLTNFYYPLQNETISWGSTLCISNKLISNFGTFSYLSGILLFVKSRNVIPV
ncbi:thiamine diphosphokinase [Oceanobacillus senegalensis]|uniref:thiamine diphosphokinase n=1 Tax=Oceanobacillus senegalensis TaxID=1936063 RepID=UPI000A313AA8|nr:thiamine diphosphokinase [Oceanobacillus senegalensis]